MRLLVASATDFEIDIFRNHIQKHFEQVREHVYCKENVEIYICITGIGMMQSTFGLMESIQEFNPHFCLQVGVAGAFSRELKLGQLVIVQSELLGDFGVEDNERFLDIFEIGLMKASESPFNNKQLINTFQDFPLRLNLPFVSSLTVNTGSGRESTITRREEHYGCEIESMEGASFHYVCLKKKIPFLQVRSISNYVEPRDKSKWKMQESIQALNDWMIGNIPMVKRITTS